MYKSHFKSLICMFLILALGFLGCGRNGNDKDKLGDADISANAEDSYESQNDMPSSGETAENKSDNGNMDKNSLDEDTVNGENTDTKKGSLEQMSSEIRSDDFYISMIPDDIFEQMQGKSYKADCNIPRDDLRYIHVLYKNIDKKICEGKMICHEIIAEDLLEIFEELYLNDYPIERMELIDVYDADDELSMTYNNSSCFNYRCISHTTTISKHGLGIAVDINPLYNPYTKVVDGKRIVEPAVGAPYLDREAEFPYKIDEDDLCYKLFTKHGFEWGGSFNSVKDYQHFELSDSVADELRARYE